MDSTSDPSSSEPFFPGDLEEEEEDLCPPPTTFRVETISSSSSSHDEPKLHWFVLPRDFFPSTKGLFIPVNPFNPIGSTAVCGLCLLRRRAFYCHDCINKGEFVHSNLRRPEDLSEKRLKDVQLVRRTELVKQEILAKTSQQQKILLLNEQIKSMSQRVKHLKYLVESKKTKLDKTDENKTKLSVVNLKRRQRLPLFMDKVRKIRDVHQKSIEDFKAKKNVTGQKLKILAQTRRQYALDIGRHIFPILPDEPPIDVAKLQDSLQPESENPEAISQVILDAMEISDITNANPPELWSSDSTEEPPAVQDLISSETDICLAEIEEEISEAMGTSYIHGRWVTSHKQNSRDIQFYRIVSATVASTDESPAYPALTDSDTDSSRTGFHTMSAALTFCAQLVTLFSASFDNLLPKRVTLFDFGITSSKTEYKFYKLISRLNLNVIYLCMAQGVDPDVLKPRQFLQNLFILFEHIKKDESAFVGQCYKPLHRPEVLYRMSETICSDLNHLAEDLANSDSEDESENDDFRDWEAVASGTPSYSGLYPGEAFPIIHSSSVSSIHHQSGMASTFVSSLFRGLTGGNQ